MKPIRLIARGIISGQVPLTGELLAALRQLADQGDPDKTTVIATTKVVTLPGSVPPKEVPFGRLVSIRPLPPRRRCVAGAAHESSSAL